MTPQRLSSWTTVWVAWVMPLIFLPLWTIVTFFLIYNNFNPAITLFIALSTISLWLFYLTIKPWQLKYIFKGDNYLIYKDNQTNNIILYSQVRRIYPSFFTKYSPIIIEYNDKGENKKISFVPRQWNVILLLPFYKHPLTEELLDEIKTGTNTGSKR